MQMEKKIISEYMHSDSLTSILSIFWCDELALQQVSKSGFEQDIYFSGKFSLAKC